MIHPEPTIRNIPLSRLELAPENVRKTPADPASFAELKASIAAHDLLENLIVRIEDPVEDGVERCAVVAGGRRLAAMKALAEEGVLDADHPVPCRVIGAAENAGELSLAENVVRVAMHPADQVVAFTKMADAGVSVTTIAARFGVAERLVEQRLRLGGVAPELLDAYRAQEMDLDTLKAFTVTTDHARQRTAWVGVKEQGYRPSGWQVRRMLTEESVPAVSAVARFVGEEAYEAAGGTLTRDLFAGEDGSGTWFDDPALLNELATRKLHAAAAGLKARWKWAEAVLETDWSAIAGFGRISPEPAAPTEEEKAERESLRVRQDELADLDNDEWTEELVEEAEGIESRLRTIDEAVEARAAFREQDFAIAGCIATVGHDGALRVVEGLVRPEDMPERTDAGEGDGTDPGRVDASAITEPLAAPPDPRAKVREETGIGIGLADDLRAVRTTLVKAHLSGDFEAAFDLTLFQIARAAFKEGYRADALDIAFRETADRPPSRADDEDFAAWSPGEAMLADRFGPLPGLDGTRGRGRVLRGDEGASLGGETGPVRGGGRAHAQGPARLSNPTPGPSSRPPSRAWISILRNTCVPPPRCSGRASGKTASSPSRARRWVPSGLLRARNTRRRTWPARWRKPSPPTRPQDSSQGPMPPPSPGRRLGSRPSIRVAWKRPRGRRTSHRPAKPKRTPPMTRRPKLSVATLPPTRNPIPPQKIPCRRRRSGSNRTRPRGRCPERGPHRGRRPEGDRTGNRLRKRPGRRGNRPPRIPARGLTRSSKSLIHSASQAKACGALFRFHAPWSP